MSPRFPSPQAVPGLVPMMLLCGVLAVAWAATPDRSSAPFAPAAVDSVALSSSLAKLKAQQDLVAANQTKIEAQTAVLAEQIRQAKIYAGRAR